MLTTALLLPLAGGLFAQPLPSSEDHLRAPEGEKRVVMVMDVSGSMAGGSISIPACPVFNAAHGITAPFMLNKNMQMKLAVNGCTGPDGLFDQWASQIDFAIVAFGYNPASAGGAVRHVQGFTRNVALLEAAVEGLPADWSTPMAWGTMEGHMAHQAWDNGDPNTYECDQHFNILMTDGIPNDPDAPDYTTFPCAAPRLINPDQYNPVNTTEYAWGSAALGTGPGNQDSVCGLDGDQPIRSYTIGFGPVNEINPALLTNMANAGGGQYYYAANAAQLANVFDEILNNISNRTVAFGTPSVRSDGLFVGNEAYSVAFKPRPGLPWVGNLKSYCVVPEKDANGNYVSELVNNRCLFKSVNGSLATNPTPEDKFSRTNPTAEGTGSRSLEADVGGVGEIFYRTFFNNREPLYNAGNDPVAFAAEFGPNYFTGRRNVITWDDTGYKAARPDTMTDAEAFASGCEKVKMFSYLHGYNPETVDCTTSAPTELSEWPFGAVVNSQQTILRWGSDCTVAGNCIVAFGADDGGVHFIDAANGQEKAMLVPKQLFVPGYTANYPLSEILNQPTRNLTRRPYVDGGLMRIHDDRNGDGIINNSEAALLVFGLGRGGRGYYFMDVSARFAAPAYAPTTANNPIYPLIPTPGNWSENLREMVSRPYVGRVRLDGSTTPEIVAVFGSGHVWYLDRPQEDLNTSIVGLPGALDPAAAQTLDCETGNEFADYNNYNPSGADLCSALYTPVPVFPFGYDCAISGCMGERDHVIGPLWFARNQGPGALPARAIGNFRFGMLDLGAGDYLVLEDMAGNAISPQLTGNLGANYVLPIWIDEPFRIRIHVDGVFSPNRGIWLDSMEWIPDTFSGGCNSGDPCWGCDANADGTCSNTLGECAPGSPQSSLHTCIACDVDQNGDCSGTECGLPDRRSCGTHYPFVAAVSLDRINGATRRPWANDTLDGSTRLMFTKQCPAGFTGGTCYDQNNTTTRDLQYMNCPITAEVRGYEEGGVARNFYVGDQCGQMWKFWTINSGTTWSARRVFNVNAANATGDSRDFRHFDRPVDLTITTCRGGRAIGVYWGTGNTARPGLLNDNLMGPTRVTAQGGLIGRDVMGVWFDDGTWDTGATRGMAQFQDLTGAVGGAPPAFDPTRPGWYVVLSQNEQMLREPLVFEGVAYFKTNQALSAGTTCSPGRSIDRVYAMSACNARPAVPGAAGGGGGGGGTGTTNDRVVWSNDTAIGSNVFIYTPTDGAPIVGSGDFSEQRTANLVPPRPNSRALQMYLWWRGV